MRTRLGLALLIASHLLVAGCTAHRPKAGTGDVAFRLLWDGVSDLDLNVLDPAGNCIAFGNRNSPSGGVLDVDCNGTSDSACEHPIENVFWPPATAPAGDYTVWVHAHSVLPSEAPLAFQLQLLRGPEVFWSHQATARKTDEFQGPFVYSFPGGKVTASTEPDALHPCGAVIISWERILQDNGP